MNRYTPKSWPHGGGTRSKNRGGLPLAIYPIPKDIERLARTLGAYHIHWLLTQCDDPSGFIRGKLSGYEHTRTPRLQERDAYIELQEYLEARDGL